MTFFKRWTPKPLPRHFPTEDRFRGSRHDRGYDWNWERLSAAWRREHPFCKECENRGALELAVHVDHKIPVRHAPELRLDRANLWSLCEFHHLSWKFRMERYAEKAHKVDKLAEWCDHPEKRPKPFR